ncbi:IS3 family transposase [Streptomyces sioyaensis]|uniref:IS3 family transposase n=1 Tax=Streptomyces sioyaensis TaxID=67364 RepID=UPI0036E5781B
MLGETITHFFNASGQTYGSPRITLDLWAEGWQVSVNTVAQVMAEFGLPGSPPPRRRRSLTRQGKRKAARDLLLRRFDAIAPDVLWVGDMTEIETGEGKPYLATVLDLFSRCSASRWALTMTPPWSARRSRWLPRPAAAAWTV